MLPSKPCGACHIEKPIDEFYEHPRGLYRRYSKCKDCTKAYAKERRKVNPEVRRLDRRRAHFRRYGLTLEERDEMFAAVEHRCPICKKRRPLVIDHSHETGEVRGPKCSNCNTAFGLLDEDPRTIRNLLAHAEALHGILTLTDAA